MPDKWLPGGGPVAEVVRCLLDATWGLAHLHNEGLLHRDLKPATLLFDAAGTTVIGDFGLAGLASADTPATYLPHVPPRSTQATTGRLRPTSTPSGSVAGAF